MSENSGLPERIELLKFYLRLLIPALTLFLFAELVRLLGKIHISLPFSNQMIFSSIFVLAVLFSLAIPIFYRTLFVYKIRAKQAISFDDYVGHEKKLMGIALITPYFLSIALLFRFSRFYFASIILLAMYSAYYYYPSSKRILFERKLFRTGTEARQEK